MVFLKVLVKNLIFDYHCDDPDQIILYSRVLVPLQKKEIIGVTLAISSGSRYTTRPISRFLDTAPLLSLPRIEAIKRICLYYHIPFHILLSSILPTSIFKDIGLEMYPRYVHTGITVKLSGAQSKAIDLFRTQEYIDQSKISPVILRSLKKLGCIKEAIPMLAVLKIHHIKLVYTAEQSQAIQQILSQKDQFIVHLVQGVTGSGKTAVYARCCIEILSQGDQIMIVVPEINLTASLAHHLQKFFDAPTEIIHSNVLAKDRLDIWLRAKAHLISVLIVTRSGIFYDLPRLKMIIVDEEHDAALKGSVCVQQPYIYHAKHACIMLAKALKIPIVLGSATPSVDSIHAAQQGRYNLIVLKQRVFETQTPQLSMIESPPKDLLSLQAIEAIHQHMQTKQQVIVFLNLLGFSNQVTCKACLQPLICKFCDKNYIYHKSPKPYLTCYRCSSERYPALCTSCGSSELCAQGTRIEFLEETLIRYFPSAKILRCDSTKKPEEMLQDLEVLDCDIIIGTQIIAKGYDFARVSLIVILEIDGAFYARDIFALERTAQTIIQISGRAGRRGQHSEILIQTKKPEQLLEIIDYQNFVTHLFQERKTLHLPPFAHMV